MHKPTERVLHILTLLTATPKGLNFTQIAAELQIPKSTLSPILQEMVEEKFLYLQGDTGLYSIGIASYCLAAAYEQEKSLLPYIQSHMKRITSQVQEICQVGVLDGPDILYILKEEPDISQTIQIISYVGKRIPAYCTALGKALLSDYSYEDLQALYPQGLQPKTDKTITDLATLYGQLQEIKRTQLATESEEITNQLCCFAVPIKLKNQSRYAMSVTMPLFRTSPEKIELTKKLLREAKISIETFTA